MEVFISLKKKTYWPQILGSSVCLNIPLSI